MKKKIVYLALFLAPIILLIYSCSKNYNTPTPNGGGPAMTSVFIQNDPYSPDTLKIKAGTDVAWVNMGGANTVTEVDGLFDSGTLQYGLSFHYLFLTPGTFRYHSTLQTSMKPGVVIVSSGNSM